uniref:Uncharacterized protein n=1 Tax=Arundo donax TaxID=35708 RepID=A0A0A9C5X4_ARUDO
MSMICYFHTQFA